MAHLLFESIDTDSLAAPFPDDVAERLCGEILGPLTDLKLFPRSLTAIRQCLLFLGRQGDKKFLGAVSGTPSLTGSFTGREERATIDNTEIHFTVAPANAKNAARLRELLPFLKPRTLGLKVSAGCGDRLGLATPGHLRAIRKTDIAPILAQQSVRENERTGRSPQQVVDDAMWAVFQEGWRGGYGADADHLKTLEDIDSFVAAGYSFYTVDPGAYVEELADSASMDVVRELVDALPWDELESSPSELLRSFTASPLDLGESKVTLNERDVLRAAAKYGKVVDHTVRMYRRLVEMLDGRPFEFEVSVDETETVTTLTEHIYLATELKRLGVRWVSLAPRYLGDFEKGVDYIGDLSEFENSFAGHVAVARKLGPYKLSLHSGSDKFSIYPIAARLAGPYVHLKTAGTSYLEALRTISIYNPSLFREIVPFAMDRYPTDRASYHVSADLDEMPDIRAMHYKDLKHLLEDFHAREVLHVTYGSVLNDPALRAPFFETLRQQEDAYAELLEHHFDKHFEAFIRYST